MEHDNSKGFVPEISSLIIVLRKKIAALGVIFLIGFMLAFHFTASMIEKIKTDLLPEGAQLVYVSPLEVMILKMKIAALLGLLFVAPLITYFVARVLIMKLGMNFQIKALWIGLSLLAATIAFLAGASYAYFVMLPLFIKYLYLNASTSGVYATYSIFKFVSFAAEATVVFGLIFEMPVVLTLLTRYDILKYQTLVTYRKHIYILFLVTGALITPPDVISQMMVSIPMIVFFEISLFIVRVFGKS